MMKKRGFKSVWGQSLVTVLKNESESTLTSTIRMALTVLTILRPFTEKPKLDTSSISDGPTKETTLEGFGE